MTKEQEEEAIENLTDLLKQRNEKQVEITTYDLFENIETVLSMLKEKDTELKKKDKIIDLMAEYIAGLDIEEDICKNTERLDECDSMSLGECERCIKQYFERKSKNEN